MNKTVDSRLLLAPLFLLSLPSTALPAAPPTGGAAARPPAAAPPPCYVKDVAPLIRQLGCSQAACHGTGRGELKLSLFATLPRQDYDALTRDANGRRIDRQAPPHSLLLRKLSGEVPHKGGPLAPAGSPARQTLLAWLSGGTRYADDKGSELVAVEGGAPTLTLQRGAAGTLAATAVYSDGSRRPVTDLTRFRCGDAAIATVSDAGRVEARGFGETFVHLQYMNRGAVVRVVVPQPLPEGFPAFPPGNRIDELVGAHLRELGVPPSELCSDAEFVRRVHLDVLGVLPTAAEVRAFLADRDPARRGKLIDRLLDRPEYADFLALKWGDLLRIKSEQDSNLWPNGVQAYHRWVRHSIATDKPYNQFARELIVSTGSNFRSPPANFYRGVRTRNAESYAEAVALAFMGVRLTCAQCHRHPVEHWSPDDVRDMAAFFTSVQIKTTHEWKEEIVYLDPGRPVKQARPLDGPQMTFNPGEDPRIRLADWLTGADNPWFARTLVNRVWYWLLGRGLVHEPDDARPSNPASNPQLLAYLADELVTHRWSVKHVFRLVLNSRTYQLSSRPNRYNGGEHADFARYRPRRLTAEQISDALGGLTGLYDPFMSYVPEPWTFLPDGLRSAQLADGSISTTLLNMFGRPARNTGYESERDSVLSVQQALFLLDSWEVKHKVANSPLLARLAGELRDDDALIDEIYLMALSRPAGAAEKGLLAAHLKRHKGDRPRAAGDVLWAVINTTEFLTNR